MIKYCINCFGYEPCLCGSPEYVTTWDFVYWAMKRTKGDF